MENRIYKKLSNMRVALRKEQFVTMDDFLEVVNKKAKVYKVLLLYCFYGDVATLTIVDLEDITQTIKFQIPVELTGLEKAKTELYKMAFDIEEIRSAKDLITPRQYIALHEKMRKLHVEEKEILERYKIKSFADMTGDIYKRCMSALDKTNRQQP